jgi:hypothetical protein
MTPTKLVREFMGSDTASNPVQYVLLGLDEVLRPEDQFHADDNRYPDLWQLIKPEDVGFTPRRWAAFGTKWRRPVFPGDKEFHSSQP